MYMRAISDLNITIPNTINGEVTDIDIRRGEYIKIPTELTSYPFIDFYTCSDERIFNTYLIESGLCEWNTLGYIPIDLLTLYFVRDEEVRL